MNPIVVILVGYLVVLTGTVHISIAMARAAAAGDKQLSPDAEDQLDMPAHYDRVANASDRSKPTPTAGPRR